MNQPRLLTELAGGLILGLLLAGLIGLTGTLVLEA